MGRPRPSDRATWSSGQKIRSSVGGYVGGAVSSRWSAGVVTAVATALLGVPYFLPLGLTMAVLGILPYVGSVVGGVLVVSATFLTSGARPG